MDYMLVLLAIIVSVKELIRETTRLVYARRRDAKNGR